MYPSSFTFVYVSILMFVPTYGMGSMIKMAGSSDRLDLAVLPDSATVTGLIPGITGGATKSSAGSIFPKILSNDNKYKI